MTYARFLMQFLLVPIILLAVLVLRDRYVTRKHGARSMGWSSFVMVIALIVVAVVYTTPWDNHLVASGVWSYDPALVSGMTLGWIPVEEFIFFPLQTLLIGLWFLWLAPRLGSPGIGAHQTGARFDDTMGEHARKGRNGSMARLVAVATCGGLWVVALVILLLRWQPGTYLGWELVWVLPPVIAQLSLGADILWRYRRLLGAILIPVVLYLCTVDALAIHDGIWTIDPRQSLGMLLGGQLPLEELVFFSLTTVLVAFGLVLGLAAESRKRIHTYRAHLSYSLGRR
ncbi:MAG TPA: lycopene cyclase domain-containing protein [Ktedonobacterales bacterium]|nr:lycopene cyclase domain-containing protein [Ktedonobacterales bacterium]